MHSWMKKRQLPSKVHSWTKSNNYGFLDFSGTKDFVRMSSLCPLWHLLFLLHPWGEQCTSFGVSLNFIDLSLEPSPKPCFRLEFSRLHQPIEKFRYFLICIYSRHYSNIRIFVSATLPSLAVNIFFCLCHQKNRPGFIPDYPGYPFSLAIW